MAGKLEYPGRSYQFSNLPEQPTRPAPLLGQHNEEVFGWDLLPPEAASRN